MVYFPPITLLLTCILQWHARVCEETFNVNSKIDQIRQNMSNFFVRKLIESTRNGKLWRLSGRFQTLIWRVGETFQNLESPGLSERVNSPAITQIDNGSFLKQANHCASFNLATRLEALNKKNLMNLWCCRIVDTCMIFTPTSVNVK